MSLPIVRSLLEQLVAGITPALPTEWQNVKFERPSVTSPWQRVTVLPATPFGDVLGSGYHREVGVVEVDLFYPEQAGSKAAETRAELVRSTFFRGRSATQGGVRLLIDSVPRISPGRPVDGWWFVKVTVPYSADVEE